VVGRLKELHAAYREDYRGYYERHATADSPAMRGADPAIVLVPGVGMFSFGKDKQTARVAGEFYINAINVMRGAEAISTYAPIEESEKFRIEYWSLEEAKLARLPKPKSHATRIALVTGAASGIGKAIATRLASDGACVVIADLNLENAQKVAEELGGSDVAIGVQADVTDEAQVVALFERTVAAYGRLDILVNNSGVFDGGPIEELSLETWRKVLEVNLTGPFLCSREAMKIMKRQGGGRIINIGSISAQMPRENAAPYATSKHGLVGLTKATALEGRAHGVVASCLHPGNVAAEWRQGGDTPMNQEPMMSADEIATVALAMAALPLHVNMLEAIVLPATQLYLGRG
jgi:rhamnulose-1-phosphate aldolase